MSVTKKGFGQYFVTGKNLEMLPYQMMAELLHRAICKSWTFHTSFRSLCEIPCLDACTTLEQKMLATTGSRSPSRPSTNKAMALVASLRLSALILSHPSGIDNQTSSN